MQNSPLLEVRAQYEDYPYPTRNPADERIRLFDTIGDSLDLVNFYCFGGRQDYGADFRVLVAGCGTGDSAVFLAEQLRATNGKVVALDFSESSLAVTRRRCEERGLSNVQFVRAAIQEIPAIELGKFDFINCTGVLHHLSDPDDGLGILASALKETGGMNLMVYGTHGRAPIYPIQELLKHVAGPEFDAYERIRRARALLKQLPQTNAFARDFEKMGRDIVNLGDAGLYDLLLHSRDRSYTVPEVYKMVKRAGLSLVSFESAGVGGKIRYDPATYLRDPELQEIISDKPLEQQHAIAELISGDMSKHSFYATKRAVQLPTLDDHEAIPFISAIWAEKDVYGILYERMATARKRGDPFTVGLGDSTTTLSLKLNPTNVLFMKHLNGERSMRELCTLVKRDLVQTPGSRGTSEDDLLRDFSLAFEGFIRSNWILVRFPGSRLMSSTDRLQRAMVEATSPHVGSV